MKKHIYALIALFGLTFWGGETLMASHYSAGEVFYQWIGNEPGKGPYDYRVFATMYRNVNGVAIGTGNLSACAFRASGAGSAISFQMTYQNPNQALDPDYRMTSTSPYGWVDTGVHPRDGDGWDIPAFEGCADSPKDISEYRYVGEVTLTGKAADWKFAVDPPCCRDGNDNLNGGGDLYIEVDLNNLKGPNSSPRIITPAARAFCVIQPGQQPFEWFQTASETDGDSLRYGFYGAGSQSGNCPGGFGGGATPIPYAPGYSAQSPLPSNPPVQINQRLGIFTLSPSAPGSFVVKIEVRELRFDTTALQWLYIGNTVRELQVPIASACKVAAEDGPELDLSKPNVSALNWTRAQVDSLTQLYDVPVVRAADSTLVGGSYANYQMPFYDGYDCFDDQITVDFDVAVKCYTVVPTDFRLIGPDGVPRPINRVETNCAVNGVSYTLDLVLYKPLDADGNYLLQIRKGNDSTTIENECGYEITPNYTAIIEVDGCPEPTYQLDGVTVSEDVHVRMDWSGNADLSDTNVLKNFDHWLIMRADAGQRPYTVIAEFQDSLARSYTDLFQNNGYYVDNFAYDYAMLMVYNGKGREYTRHCSNINLKQDTPKTTVTNMALYWTPYNCIGDSVLEYDIYRGRVDSAHTSVTWNYVNTTQDTSYNLSRPEPDSLNAGAYAVKVTARNNSGANPADSSESNWQYYYITYVPPPDPPDPLGEVIIPNVITPNNDGLNDRFYIQPPLNADSNYESISVAIYNRWGRLVFEDPDFESRNSKNDGWAGTAANGSPVANGVYYYVIQLRNPSTGQNDQLRGNITVTNGGI